MPARRRAREVARAARRASSRYVPPSLPAEDVDAWLASACSSMYCTTPRATVTVAPDPYDAEIHGDETPVALCENCRYRRYMEV